MEIKYKVDLVNSKRLTVCPNGKGPMVGSSACRRCDHFVQSYTSSAMDYVQCKFKKENQKAH